MVFLGMETRGNTRHDCEENGRGAVGFSNSDSNSWAVVVHIQIIRMMCSPYQARSEREGESNLKFNLVNCFQFQNFSPVCE